MKHNEVTTNESERNIKISFYTFENEKLFFVEFLRIFIRLQFKIHHFIVLICILIKIK